MINFSIKNKTLHKGCKNNTVCGVTIYAIGGANSIIYKMNFIDEVKGHFIKKQFTILLHTFSISLWLKRFGKEIFLTIRCDEIDYD